MLRRSSGVRGSLDVRDDARCGRRRARCRAGRIRPGRLRRDLRDTRWPRRSCSAGPRGRRDRRRRRCARPAARASRSRVRCRGRACRGQLQHPRVLLRHAHGEHQLADVVQHAGEERGGDLFLVEVFLDGDAVRGGRGRDAVRPQRLEAEARAPCGDSPPEKMPWPSTSAMMRSRPSSAPARATSATGLARPK